MPHRSRQPGDVRKPCDPAEAIALATMPSNRRPKLMLLSDIPDAHRLDRPAFASLSRPLPGPEPRRSHGCGVGVPTQLRHHIRGGAPKATPRPGDKGST